jgi:hypothetical protein
MPLALEQFFRFVLLIIAFAIATTTGNAFAASYKEIKEGLLKGKIIVQWWEPDKFVFLPDKDDPLTFKRSNGDTIIPGGMMTDFGTIPRPLWIFRNYSPWGYAPAFIVHDWLFHMKHCGIPGNEKYNHHIAATIMAEVMKTMMERGKVEVAKTTLYAMYEAVDSRYGKSHWDSGKCELAPTGFARKEPLYEFELKF